LEHRKSCGCLKRTKGFNQYKIDGDTTIIYFTNKLNEIVHEGYIDTEDLDKLIKQNLCWSAGMNNTILDYYAFATEYQRDENGKRKGITHFLHRDIMNAQKREYVDHIIHKPQSSLDNRKSNLRVTDNEHNSKNKNGKNKNNKSGYRNVSWNGNGWTVQLQVNGVNTVLKRFKKIQLEEAGVYAEEMRQKIYGEFAGITLGFLINVK